MADERQHSLVLAKLYEHVSRRGNSTYNLAGSWPRLMRAETAARYLDENSVELNYQANTWRAVQDETANTYVIEVPV
jgi:hypothetical protein